MPRASAPSPSRRAALSFVVHKHAARRLHYDFRLEHGGVLLSWAIPKGPSLDPHEKRLAVRVEDHPLDYGGFEGNLPEGKYGAGPVLIWDRGVWEPEEDPAAGLRAGKLVFRLHGEKLRGGFALVRMGGRAAREGRENWLLIKARDEEAARPGAREKVDRSPRSVVTGRTIEEVAAEADRPGKGKRKAR
jgi:bifunctional non-homologous end joining protein LigD